MTLPQFCLSYFESRWVWLGFRPPLPARNACWSWTRTLVLTLGQTLVGALIGAGLTLLFTGLPHSSSAWLVWLTAGISWCQGIIGYALTAFYWNQRAARLQANPELDVSIPPSRYPFLRALLNVVYFALLALVTPVAMVVTFENIRGEMLWNRERARLAAAGERLTFHELLGSAIAPNQNAGATAIFAPLFDYHMENVRTPDAEVEGRYIDQNQPVWRDTNATQQLEERLGFPDSHWPSSEKAMSSAPHTPKIDLAGWANAYRSLLTEPKTGDPAWVAELKLPASTNDPASVVLAGLAVADRELAAFCEVSTRPRAQFPVHYEDSFNSQVPHLKLVKVASQRLALRCAAHLAAGETDAAFDDAQCALRVAELLREEPLLISQLVRLAQGSIATRTVWQGLAEHRWSDAQLTAFQEQLAKVEYLSGMVLAFEGERACGIQAINNMISKSRSMDGLAVPTGSGGVARVPAKIALRGWLRQNQVSLAHHQSQMIGDLRAALSNSPPAGLVAVTAVAAKSGQPKVLTPYNLFAWRMAPATEGPLAKALRMQTLNRMAIVACALERYRLKHGVFPETLAALAPAFLPVPPLDPVNNRPFHYQRTDDGWFRLYSVGADGKDDGGVFKSSTKSPDKDWPWPVPTQPEKFLPF